jgi:hypothetical protein
LDFGFWAVLTGATSGIGLETARLLSEAGFNLLLCARNSDDLNATAAALPGQCLVVSADLSTEAGIHRLVDAAGNLDAGLFYHAAGYGTSGLFVDSDVAQEANMWRLNTGSVLHLTHYFSRVFKEKRRGGVVLLGSIVGFQGVPYAAHYAATKAYVQSLGEALALELKPFGVDVLTAAPGPVASRFGDRAGLQMSGAMQPSDIAAPILRALGRRDTVLPGTLSKVLVWALRTVPRWGKVRIMKMVMGGMTKHQRLAAEASIP